MSKKHTTASDTLPNETPEPAPLVDATEPEPAFEAAPLADAEPPEDVTKVERFIIPGTIQAVDRNAILGLGLDPDKLQREEPEPSPAKRKR